MDTNKVDLIDEIYEDGKRIEATWVAVALLYGKPPSMLDANFFEVKQAMAKFREALIGQFPYIAKWDDVGLMRVHRLYTEWYVTQKWEKDGVTFNR